MADTVTSGCDEGSNLSNSCSYPTDTDMWINRIGQVLNRATFCVLIFFLSYLILWPHIDLKNRAVLCTLWEFAAHVLKEFAANVSKEIARARTCKEPLHEWQKVYLWKRWGQISPMGAINNKTLSVVEIFISVHKRSGKQFLVFCVVVYFCPSVSWDAILI